MSYSLNFTGNVKDVHGSDGHAAEVEVYELAKDFAKKLEKYGLLGSHMHGTHIGHALDLNAEEPQVFNPTH